MSSRTARAIQRNPVSKNKRKKQQQQKTSTTAYAIALTQEVKTPSFVNHLAKNVTNVLSIQEDLDRHWKQWIDVLYDAIQIIR